MGQYRFSIYAKWQIGLMLTFDEYTIEVHLPFMAMYFARTKEARGYEIFGKYID